MARIRHRAKHAHSLIKIMMMLMLCVWGVTAQAILVSTFVGSAVYGTLDIAPGTISYAGVNSINFDRSGNLIVVDTMTKRVRKIDRSGNIRTIAGKGVNVTINGQLVDASINEPTRSAIDKYGNIYVLSLIHI
jgi:hypothetical protein